MFYMRRNDDNISGFHPDLLISDVINHFACKLQGNLKGPLFMYFARFMRHHQACMGDLGIETETDNIYTFPKICQLLEKSIYLREFVFHNSLVLQSGKSLSMFFDRDSVCFLFDIFRMRIFHLKSKLVPELLLFKSARLKNRNFECFPGGSILYDKIN